MVTDQNYRGRRCIRPGFSLVELLAVVLILAVIAGVAVPIYLSSRQSSAARACLHNLALITRAEAAYMFRNGEYGSLSDLVGTPEGLDVAPTCPLARKAYTVTGLTPGTPAAITIACPDETEHQKVLTSSWTKQLPKPHVDEMVP